MYKSEEAMTFVSVSDLEKAIAQLKEDKMKYVRLSIFYTPKEDVLDGSVKIAGITDDMPDKVDSVKFYPPIIAAHLENFYL